MKSGRNTAFTVELMGLFILLVMVITVISSVFVMSRAHSLQARQLTEAVILAENAAELSSAAPDNETLMDMIADMDNTAGHNSAMKEYGDTGEACVVARVSVNSYDASAGDGQYVIRLTRKYPYGTSDERSDGGTYTEDQIEVFAPDDSASFRIGTDDPSGLKDPVYTLNAGTYFSADSISGEGGAS